MIFGRKYVNKDLISFANDEGEKLRKFQIECYDDLKRQAALLLNILLSGAGCSLAMAVNFSGWEVDAWKTAVTLSVSFYLFILSLIIIVKCLKSMSIYPIGNVPVNIYNEDNARICLVDYQKEWFESVEMMLDHNRAVNDSIAYWLNIVRILSACTPVVVMIAFIFSYKYKPAEAGLLVTVFSYF